MAHNNDAGDGFQYQRGGRVSRGYAQTMKRGTWHEGAHYSYSVKRSDPHAVKRMPDPLDRPGIPEHANPYGPLYGIAGYDWHDAQYGPY